MNDFMSEVGPCLESISNIEKKAEKLVADSQNKPGELATAGCGYGCLTSIVGCSAIASAASGGGLLLMLLLPPLVGFGIGVLLNVVNKKPIERKIEKAKREAKRMKLEAEENLKLKAMEFMENHSL